MNHPLSGERHLSLEQLAGYSAILPDMSTFTGRIVKGMFEDQGLKLQVGMSTNYLETIKMLIGVGLGWSVLPRTMVDDDVAVLDLHNVPIARTLGVIHHVQRTLSNAGQAFIELLRKSANYS